MARGDWPHAALLLNGYNDADIRSGALFVDLTDLSAADLEHYKDKIRQVSIEEQLRDVSDSDGHPKADELNEELRTAAQQITLVPVKKIHSASDWGIWAYSQCLLNRYDLALQGYSKALAFDPKNARIWFEYAQAYAAAGAYELERRARIGRRMDRDVEARVREETRVACVVEADVIRVRRPVERDGHRIACRPSCRREDEGCRRHGHDALTHCLPPDARE